MEKWSSIFLTFGTLYERIATQSRTKFGANLINSHRAMDDDYFLFALRKVNLLSHLQGKPLMGITLKLVFV